MKFLVPMSVTVALLASSAAFAQSSPPAVTPATPPSATAPKAAMPGEPARTMTEEQAKAWINKSVYTRDDKNVGTIAAILRDVSGKVTEIHADVGGFLGLGAQRVLLTPMQVRFTDDRVIADLTADQVKSLPKVEK